MDPCRNTTTANISQNLTADKSDGEYIEGLIKYYTMDIGIPFVCAFGMFGNFLNFMVLTREKISISLTKMEKSAHIGLIGLAISDFMFCLLAFLFTRMPFQSQYTELNIVLYYQWLGPPMITWFIVTSTWLTVAMAGERYLAVCHPFKARKVISLKRTRIIIFLIYIICLTLIIPLGFEKEVSSKICNETIIYAITQRPAFNDRVMGMRRLAWAIVFDFIPCISLLFFNTCLIWKIHHAKKLRNTMAPGHKNGELLTKYPRELFSYTNTNNSGSNSNHQHCRQSSSKQSVSFRNRSSPPELLSRHMTPQKRQMRARRRQTDNALNSVTATLVAVVVLFLILVSPSEILKFIYTNSAGNSTHTYDTIRHITNLMQAVNFSVNFLLYCAVNKSFRASLRAIFCFCCKKGKKSFRLQNLERAYCHRVEFSESESQ